jgi:CubicO group peptidase (beta-lactamase class C family)
MAAVVTDAIADMEARRFLDREIAAQRTPGIQYLFLTADAVLFAYNAGMANLPHGVPVADRTTFNVYSVTKTLTAAAILQLAGQGKIGLDQPIARYLDRWPYDQRPTVRQTLSHTGGFPNPIPISWVHLIDEHPAFDKTRFVHGILDKYPRLRTAPGQSFAYSNIGYLLLGEAIATSSGLPYTEYVERHLIRPLSLSNGEVMAFSIDQPAMHARGYLVRWSPMNLALGFFIDRKRYVDARSGRWIQLRHHYVNGAAYGGLIGNTRGLSRYLQALLASDNYLSPQTRALLFSPAHTRDGHALARSLGWFTGRLGDEPYFAHAGGGAGYYCELRLYPRSARASVVTMNRAALRDERYLDRVDRFFLANRNA